MDWLLVFLGIAGLTLLWLAIKGLDVWARKLKKNEAKSRADAADRERRYQLASHQYEKIQAAKDYIANADNYDDNATGEVPPEFVEAMSVLSSDDLLDTMVQVAFNNNEAGNNILAERSAFANEPQKVAVAKGRGVTPIKAQPSTKSHLTKTEEKIFKKIKQGA